MLKADANISINVYPIATTNSTITIRADLLQERKPETFDTVFSTSYVLAARNKENQKQQIPQIDLAFSDDPALAQQRYDLARNQNDLFRYYDPLKSSTRAPIQAEFDILQKLFQLEKMGGVKEETDNFVDMNQTAVQTTKIIHSDTTNHNKRIFGGYLMNQSI